MAATRRRSRISDAAAQQQQQQQQQDQRATPRAVSVVAERDHTATAEDETQVEVAESIDIWSPSQSPQQNRSTTAACRRCNTVVGQFYNAFVKITGSYYVPAMPGSYSSRLKNYGRQKPATQGNDVEGCLIQPLACPNSICNEVLGFHTVDAPAHKQAFRGRDFFKLPRIQLRCETSPGHLEVVEPQVDAAAAPLVDESGRPSPAPAVQQPASVMEVDTRPLSHASHPPPGPSLPPLGPPPQSHPQSHTQSHTTTATRHEPHHHQPQPLQQVEANRQSLPPPVQSPRASATLGLPQKSPTNALPSPSVKPVHDVQFAQPQPRETTVGLANRTRDLPPVMAHSQSPADHHRATNGQYYPRASSEVSLDAIERLQTQISQNSGAVSVHSRDLAQLRETAAHVEEGLRRDFQNQLHQQNSDIRRVDEAVGRLQLEMRDIRQLLEVLTHDVQTLGSRSVAAAAPTTVSAQDSALELMAQQITNMSHKANEVDTLKITIEIMKNKIQRLEDATIPNSGQQPPGQAVPSPLERSAQSVHTVPSYHATPAPVPHINTPVHPVNRQASFHSHGSHSGATPELTQRPEPAPGQSGWVTVNSSVKRAHSNGVEHEHPGQPHESPKRPKLAAIEPRAGFPGSQHPQHVYEHMDTDDSDSRATTLPHTLPSQPQTQAHHPHEATTEVALIQPSVPSQHAQHPAYAAYHTQDAPPDDSWRPESQRIEHRTPRGRGRGGGPGSRGGRGRKSLPTQVHLGTPEWEREDWQGLTDSQTSPDGYYNHVARSGRGIIRRGSGGSTRGRPPSSPSSAAAAQRAVSLGMQGVTPGLAVNLTGVADPYAHTKKTRSKPVRNADGILIRKDGRPDMRSQSSAANLRKVHARKEELLGKDGELREFSPLSSSTTTNAPAGVMGKHQAGVAETPSPTTGYLPPSSAAAAAAAGTMETGTGNGTGTQGQGNANSQSQHQHQQQPSSPGQAQQAQQGQARPQHAHQQPQQNQQPQPPQQQQQHHQHHDGKSDPPTTTTTTSSVQKKHNLIMGKMFPGGVDESRREHDLSRKVFEDGVAHDAQPKFQAHTHHAHHSHAHSHSHANAQHGRHAGAGPPGGVVSQTRKMIIKSEPHGDESQSPDDGDVDMERDDGEGDEADEGYDDEQYEEEEEEEGEGGGEEEEERTPASDGGSERFVDARSGLASHHGHGQGQLSSSKLGAAKGPP